MIRFISLIFIPINFYWASMIEFISSTKLRNNTIETPFGIPGDSTEHEIDLRVNPIVESKICFLLEIYQYSYD